jgi:exosortase
MSARPTTDRLADLPLLGRLNLALLVGLTLALTLLLWPHWCDNPELSHGFLMPFICGYLILEARSGPPRFFRVTRGLQATTVGLLAAGMVALGASGLYAAALDWDHALVAFTLTVSVVFFLGAGLLAFGSEEARYVPVNWTSVVAIGLWLLSAPIPPGTYSRMTIGLQLLVTQNVLHGLHLLGIAADRQGNIIELAYTSVGVEEACSGIRSLISCIFAGLLFSATLVRRGWARVLLVALSVPMAIGMNFIRSLTLTLLANSGVNIAGRWHDLTGFAVLGITAIMLGLLARVLGDQAGRTEIMDDTVPGRSAPAFSSRRQHRFLTSGLTLAVLLGVFFYANTRPSTRASAPAPDLAAILPTNLLGWRVKTAEDLYQFSSTLRTENLVQRTYFRPSGDGLVQITFYLAYWRAGQAPVSLVASHTPDACWPGTGWKPVDLPETRESVSVGGRQIAPAEARKFISGEFPQYVWFWHLYDGRPIAFRDPYSAGALLKIAWRYGFTHGGDQLFVRVSSNVPWAQIASEPVMRDVFTRLQPLGL